MNENKLKPKISGTSLKTDHLIKLAKTGKYSSSQLKKIFNCGRSLIFKILKGNKISLHNKGKFKRKYHYNEEFFQNLTPTSAYWLGIIASDGYLYLRRGNEKSVNLRFNKRDFKHINKFLFAIKSNIKPHYTKSTNSIGISIYSSKLFDSLIKLGVKPNKSLSIKRINIKNSLMAHFIRGVSDGDGSISGNRRTHIQFMIAGNKPFLEQIQEVLIKNCNLNKTKVYPLYKSKAFKLQYTGIQTLKILDFIYKDSKEEIRLNRKYKKYLEFKNKFEKLHKKRKKIA